MKKGPYAAFATDTSVESEKGLRIEYDGFTIIVHRAGGSNSKYSQMIEAKLKPYRRQIQAGTLDAKTNRRLLAEVYAEAVIVGWENVVDQDGNPMEFNRDNCVKLLTDLEELFNDIIEMASDFRNFRQQTMEVDAKNLPKS